jgi:hypothetical protein
MRTSRSIEHRSLVESRMRGNVHVRFGGREWGNGAGETRPPRPLPTRHMPLERQAAHLFFQLISRRYEKGSMLITTNQSVTQWGTVFGDDVIAAAILDRLLHHSHTFMVQGESYRLRQKRKAGLRLHAAPQVDLCDQGGSSSRRATGAWTSSAVVSSLVPGSSSVAETLVVVPLGAPRARVRPRCASLPSTALASGDRL